MVSAFAQTCCLSASEYRNLVQVRLNTPMTHHRRQPANIDRHSGNQIGCLEPTAIMITLFLSYKSEQGNAMQTKQQTLQVSNQFDRKA